MTIEEIDKQIINICAAQAGVSPPKFPRLGLDDELIDTWEVRRILKLDRHEIYRLARAGELPAIRLGKRKLRFSKRAVMAWLQRGANN